MPIRGRLRALLYRILLGYEVRATTIGYGTVVAVDSARLVGCEIASFNIFSGPATLDIRRGVRISHGNRFACGSWTASPDYASHGFERRLLIDEGSFIASKHYFDISGFLLIGRNVWVAGRDSQFWTHGARSRRCDVHIGDRSFIGSAVRFAPGSGVSAGCMIGIGSVVTKRFPEENVVIGGAPAVVIGTREARDNRLR